MLESGYFKVRIEKIKNKVSSKYYFELLWKKCVIYKYWLNILGKSKISNE